MQKEHFQQDIRIYSTQRLNYDAWIRRKTQKQGLGRSISIESWGSLLEVLKQTKTLPEEYRKGANSVSLIIDPLDAQYVGQSFTTVEIPEGHFVVLGDPRKMLTLDCAIDFFGKRIGWVDISDYYLLRAFMNGYRIPPSSIELVQLSINDIPKVAGQLLQGGKDGGLDYVVTYMVPQSDYHALWRMQPVALYGFKNLNIDRIKLYYPYVRENVIDLPTTFTSQDRGQVLMVNLNHKDDPVLTMTKPLWVLQGDNPLLNRSVETFITEYVGDAAGMDPSYRCYGNPIVERKAECNSMYDVIGLPKRFFSLWDRPCVKNEDCPYYRANKNYPNDRGGCLAGGVCEMPVGTQRIAYQKLSPGKEFTPFCYGCDNRGDLECCAKQERPDYAFPNDTTERRKAGLTTILSMT